MNQRIPCGSARHLSPAFYLFVTAFLIGYLLSSGVFAQVTPGETEQSLNLEKDLNAQPTASGPFLKEYRKVAIGMPADTLREAWGKPKAEYSDGYLYEMSDSETIQIVIGAEKEIKTISVTFADGKGAPEFTEVFGEAVTPERRDNGSVYKMVRYPEAGYWVSFYSGPPANPNVSLTMQKL